MRTRSWLGALALAILPFTARAATGDDDRATVAALDVAYQAAVKRNDAETMARILDERFVLVLGSGQTYSRADLLDAARTAAVTYERQDEESGSQVVRVYGDTAVVTAKLWIRYATAGRTVERRLWFSDTYVRTPAGWKYVFGQASLPLPAPPSG
jgi:ketosteroid isomerase-like protein